MPAAKTTIAGFVAITGRFGRGVVGLARENLHCFRGQTGVDAVFQPHEDLRRWKRWSGARPRESFKGIRERTGSVLFSGK